MQKILFVVMNKEEKARVPVKGGHHSFLFLPFVVAGAKRRRMSRIPTLENSTGRAQGVRNFTSKSAKLPANFMPSPNNAAAAVLVKTPLGRKTQER
jgi:hypothetical protein